jgi:protein-disulfide isomerase
MHQAGTGRFTGGKAALFGLATALVLTLAACSGGVTEGLTTGTISAASAGASGELEASGPLEEKVLGRADAPITVIEYASLGCPICAVFHQKVFPKFKADYIDSGKVRFIYREFPIGKSSGAAAQAARCAPDSQYFTMNDRFMATRGRWNAREPSNDLLYKIVQETGLTRAAFDSCMANQKISEGIDWVKQRGRKLGVKGTPTFFINGQHVRGYLSYDELRQHLDKQLKLAASPA